MSELLSSVSEHLLAPGGVTIESLQGVLGDLAGPGIDAADLYFPAFIAPFYRLFSPSALASASDPAMPGCSTWPGRPACTASSGARLRNSWGRRATA